MKSNDAKVQGIFDIISAFDKETIEKVQQIIKNIDPDKIKTILDSINVTEDRIQIKLDLSIKR